MARILVIYCSRTGNTEKMAGLVAEGVMEEGLDVRVRKAEATAVDDLVDADGIIMGSPVYKVKKIFLMKRKRDLF